MGLSVMRFNNDFEKLAGHIIISKPLIRFFSFFRGLLNFAVMCQDIALELPRSNHCKFSPLAAAHFLVT